MRLIIAPDAPKAITHYSHAGVIGNILFTSGQIPLVPETGELVGESIEAQTEQVIKNLTAILRAAGTDWSRVARAMVYLTNLGDYAGCNTVYTRMMGAAKPARSCVQVADIPKGAKVMIELVAEV
jgi:2-iminobutanoate/2-iminopropanoate deaminase